MSSVLVTGARGFIGQRCLPLLRARGFEVHAVTSQAGIEDGATWHQCDLLNTSACDALIERVRPTHLLHLAWYAQPGAFWTSSASLDWLAAGIRLARRFYDTGGVRAVGAGSCAEYAATDLPCREDITPIAPATLYGEAKASMHFALRATAHERGSWAWGRLFAPYGPGEPPGRFIPAVIDGLLRREPVSCTHGRQVRDFVYVDDVAEACVALVDSEATGAYNVGSGDGRSLKEVADIIIQQLGRGELVRFGEREAPKYDPARVVADGTKILTDAGWSPKVSLQEGIRRSISGRMTMPGRA